MSEAAPGHWSLSTWVDCLSTRSSTLTNPSSPGSFLGWARCSLEFSSLKCSKWSRTQQQPTKRRGSTRVRRGVTAGVLNFDSTQEDEQGKLFKTEASCLEMGGAVREPGDRQGPAQTEPAVPPRE